MNTPEFKAPADHRTRLDVVIAEVWQEPDPMNVGWLLTKYRLEQSDGEGIGTFHTPASSRLSKALMELARKTRGQ